MVVFRKFYFGMTSSVYLIWNLFLAWIPLILSIIINYIYAYHKSSGTKSFYMLGFGFLWIVFYPNAPYIITDFIHMKGIQYYFTEIGYRMNYLIWYDFIMISLFIFTGFLIGFVSLYLIQMMLIDRFNSVVGWIFVAGILFLSSFGIYLGRFIRWNSWDILFNPKTLVTSLLTSFNEYAIEFTISFGLFLILMYFALYYLTNLNEYKKAFIERH